MDKDEIQGWGKVIAYGVVFLATIAYKTLIVLAVIKYLQS
jgi:hypothetical protein